MRGERLIPSAAQLSAMAMDGCCIYLALNLATRPLGLWRPVVALIFFCYLLSFLLPWTLGRRQGVTKAGKVSARAGVIMVAVVAALALWGRLWGTRSWTGEDIFLVVLQAGLAGLCCWLGSGLSRYGRDYQEACDRFQIWLLVLFVLAAIDERVYPAVPVFFLLACLSLALTRWGVSISGTIAVLKPCAWRLVLLGAGGVCLASGLLLGAVSPGFVQAFVNGLGVVGAKILGLLQGIDVHRSGDGIDVLPIGCSMKPPAEETAFPTNPPHWGEATLHTSPVVLWLLLFLLIACVLCLVFFAVKRLMARAAPQSAAAGRVEILQIRQGLFAAALRLLRKLVNKLRDWLARISRNLVSIMASIKSGRRGGAPIPLRKLYLGLLKWGARRGMPRSRFQTPLEYLKTLCLAFPDKESELSFMTEAYLQARYSRNSPGEDVVAAAGEAWRSIRAVRAKRPGRRPRMEKPGEALSG